MTTDLSKIKENIMSMDDTIKEAKKLIAVMKGAGEDTSQLEMQFRDLEVKKKRWENSLKEQGY